MDDAATGLATLACLVLLGFWCLSSKPRKYGPVSDAEVPQNDDLTADQRAKLDQLYEQFRQRLSEDGGQWPEFKGDGQ